ncbi:MAG: GNAT family N-acetyltransferase [Actinomycetota bacterium]|nr:MAG: GNAT family N-acetyltransferase [Actinomycetota bacterium]
MDATRRGSALVWATRPRSVDLRDNRVVTVRAARTSDVDALALMHGRCAPDTLYGRYQNAAPPVSRTWQRRLLSTELALVAFDRKRLVALANLSPRDGGSAELSVLVEDAFQGVGLGRALARQVAATARLLGYRRLVVMVVRSALAARNLLATIGPAVVVDGADGDPVAVLQLGMDVLGGLPDPDAVGTRQVAG